MKLELEHGHKINILNFAADIDLLEEDRDELQENQKRLNDAGEASGLKMDIQKSMTMVFDQENIIEELMNTNQTCNRVCVPL